MSPLEIALRALREIEETDDDSLASKALTEIDNYLFFEKRRQKEAARLAEAGESR